MVREWALAAQQGDQDAFGQLVEHYQHAAYNLAYRMLGNAEEAQDAAQEAFMRAYANLHRYDIERSFKTWLLSITSNHCIDRLRKRRLTWLSIDDEDQALPSMSLVSDEPTPEQAYVNDERSAAMQALLAQVPPDYRTVIILRYWYDMSYTEIAETLETTESAIKSRLFRARQALGQLLEEPSALAALNQMKPAMEGS
ncbi:MAG: sigma-70 family RNA polymerase sigma factor [Anaerolineae bacterium]|nr:sigma-70 family RNA polymerase sigma factor [Anaerolineae bacterium]